MGSPQNRSAGSMVLWEQTDHRTLHAIHGAGRANQPADRRREKRSRRHSTTDNHQEQSPRYARVVGRRTPGREPRQRFAESSRRRSLHTWSCLKTTVKGLVRLVLRGSVYQSIRRRVKLPVDSRYAVRLTQAEQHRNRTSPSDNAAGFWVLSNDCSARVLQ